MDLYEVCKMMYKAFSRSGSPGIEAIGEVDNTWVFSPAPEDPDIVEYGSGPYFVDKKTGLISCFEVDNRDDWSIIDSAVQLKVPEEFLPKYS